MSRRVLVTGSAGFLGRHLCRMLMERGETPIGLDVETDPDAPFMQVVGSVNDPQAWKTAREVDAVVHGAALTDLWRSDPDTYDEVNRGGAVMAARYAKAHALPLVIVSSYTVLLPNDRLDERQVTGREEVDPDKLIGPYAKAKRRGELEALDAYPAARVVRPSALIGPGDPGPTPPMRMLRDLVSGQLPGVMAGRINVVDVRDVAEGTLTALDKGSDGGAYLLSGTDLSLKQFAQQVAQAAGARAPMLEVPVPLARLAARLDHWQAEQFQKPVTAPRDGVELAALPVTFDARFAQEKLRFTARSLEHTIADAVADVKARSS
ncbi:MAG: NAD-dependent epimerase/dehydratase family protein [Pseudomonadota bacterium]